MEQSLEVKERQLSVLATLRMRSLKGVLDYGIPQSRTYLVLGAVSVGGGRLSVIFGTNKFMTLDMHTLCVPVYNALGNLSQITVNI